MRCSNCKAYLPYDTKQKVCPACGEPIKKKPFLEDVINMSAEIAAERNFLFWGMVILILWVVVGIVEFSLSSGKLFKYFEDNIFYSLIIFLYWGFVIEIIAKVNAQIRLASRTVILKERRSLRIFRLGTNISFLLGLALSVIWVGPDKFFARLPGITLITTSIICLFWALEGMFFRDEHFEDHRVRNFFLLLGVRHPHPYRLASAWYIGGIVFALIIYLSLSMFPSIFWGIYNSWFIQSSIKVINSFIQYLPV